LGPFLDEKVRALINTFNFTFPNWALEFGPLWGPNPYFLQGEIRPNIGPREPLAFNILATFRVCGDWAPGSKESPKVCPGENSGGRFPQGNLAPSKMLAPALGPPYKIGEFGGGFFPHTAGANKWKTLWRGTPTAA